MNRKVIGFTVSLFLVFLTSDLAEGMSPEKKALREKSYKEQDAKLMTFQGLVSQKPNSAKYEFVLSSHKEKKTLLIKDDHSKLFIFNEILKNSLGKELRVRGVYDENKKALTKIISVIPAKPIIIQNGQNTLSYKDAEVSKHGLRVGVLGANHFRREGITLSWRVSVKSAGEFLLAIDQSSNKPGAKYEIHCNGKVIQGIVKKTKNLKDIQKKDLGKVNLVKGENIVQFKILTMIPTDNSKAGLNLRGLLLEKAKK